MSLSTFIHSDWPTKRKKFVKWWHRNDWKKAHTPSLITRIKTEWYYLVHKSECLIVDGWLVKFYETKETYMNWGDDINVYMLEKMTGKKIIPDEMLLFKQSHHQYACIGSIIPGCLTKRTTVWGSGCMNFELQIKRRQQPQTIKAVRGPLTREYLLRNGIECPEVYGDPALLLPKVYQPVDKTKKYPLTIIPHHHDWDDQEALMDFVRKYLPKAHIINMTDYAQWTDVIDEIVQSEIVLSSSLHGLIVSDAYGIPNVFMEFHYHHPKYDKYKDYYLSVQREFREPIIMRNIQEVKDIQLLYKKPKINSDKLLNACPFKNRLYK